MSKEHELINARRTIEKAHGVLKQCENYFEHQAQMNAQAHLSARAVPSPIHSAITGALHGIHIFQEAYPE